MENNLKKINSISYSRIEAIDGFLPDFGQNLEIQSLLEGRNNLLYKKFSCITFQQEWIYDGTISTSFPGLNLYGHQGAKGLILSNIKAFKECLHHKDFFHWFCILEDDAILNNDIYLNLLVFLNTQDYQNLDIVLLDKRGGGGTAGIVYNSKIIPTVMKDLHPLSSFSIEMEKKYQHSPLWDWKLWFYINNTKINYILYPCIDCESFLSTINE